MKKHNKFNGINYNSLFEYYQILSDLVGFRTKSFIIKIKICMHTETGNQCTSKGVTWMSS